MAFPIAVQLYSVRDYIAKEGFAPVLKRIADIGYKGVEPAGFFGVRPSELKKMVDDLGLKLYSTHSPWARKLDDLPEQLDIAAVLGLDTIVCGFGPDDFKDLDAIKRSLASYRGHLMHGHTWKLSKKLFGKFVLVRPSMEGAAHLKMKEPMENT